MKYLISLMALILVGCGGAQLDYLILEPCSPVLGEGGLAKSLAGAYKDPGTGTIYSIMTNCNFTSFTLDKCQTQAYIMDWLREGGTSRLNVVQSKEMAGCLPVGQYKCLFAPNPYNHTLQVDCGDKGVLNLNRL